MAPLKENFPIRSPSDGWNWSNRTAVSCDPDWEQLNEGLTVKCFGLDLGSSTIKGAVLDLATRQVGEMVAEQFPEPVAGLPERFLEIPVERVAEVVTRLVTRLMEIEPTVTAIFSCGQMGGVVLTDPETGQPLTNYLSWRDQRTLADHPRGGNFLDEMQRRWSRDDFASLGSELKPGSATSLLFWLSEQGLLPSRAVPSGLGDVIFAQLCRTKAQMEPTQAIGLLDLTQGGWHHAAFAKLGLDRLTWPTLAQASRPVGSWELLGKSFQCYPVLGDQQCALRGAGIEVGDLSLNISTGGQVSRLTETLQLGAYQSRYFFDGRYLNTITHLPAGRSLNVLLRLLTDLARAENREPRDPWGSVNRALAHADGAGLACDLAFFSGPMGDTGSITGITVDNLTIGNLFHAAFENMAGNFASCAERVFPERDWHRLVLSGGMTQSVSQLRQMIQSRLPGPMKESTETEETLVGLLEVARSILINVETV